MTARSFWFSSPSFYHQLQPTEIQIQAYPTPPCSTYHISEQLFWKLIGQKPPLPLARHHPQPPINPALRDQSCSRTTILQERAILPDAVKVPVGL